MSRHIAVYGGSFDPPHRGHKFVIEAVLACQDVTQLWIVPAGDDRYDKSALESGQHRLKMVELMLAEWFPGEERIKVKTEQLEGILPESYSIDLLDFFLRQNDGLTFSFVIGADNFYQISGWKESARLLSDYGILIAARPGVELPEDLQDGLRLIEHPDLAGINVSSTAIRDEITDELIQRDSMPATVSEYIERNQLYQKR